MDKNAIKKYAVWARRELISRVSQKAMQYGITESEIVPANAASVNGKVLSGEEISQRRALIEQIKNKGKTYEQVMEEIAYTWFNRFIALRFMEVNGYLPSHVRVFTDENNAFKPQILAEAINLELDGLDMNKVFAMKDANDNDALFKYLVIVQCNALSPILPGMFQHISDYTELLFPDNLLRDGSAIQRMIEWIPEDDWKVDTDKGKDTVQIIGWLYQFYNTEPKAEVFAKPKGTKISKEEIPAATQLFTPDWIVRYMVENSLGRLWVEGHPNEELKSNWKYYLEEAEQEPEVQIQLAVIRKEYADLTPEQIKCIDPCSGSGHILAYMFDVLMQIYETYGYTIREAVRSIIENNIYGLDIDDRAAQLAYFAVMMKARQYDRRFLTRKDEDDNPDVPQPRVYAIKESNGMDAHALEYFVNGDPKLKKAMDSIIREMRDAKEYGSILNITPVDFAALYARFEEVADDISLSKEAVLHDLLPLVQVAEVLARKYDVVVTNPPYMSVSAGSAKLNKYVKDNFPDSKTDLFSVFIDHGFTMLKTYGFEAMITMESWMFLSSFEKLRYNVCSNNSIVSLVHMPYLGKGGTSLGINFGTEMSVIRKCQMKNYFGTYDRISYYETNDDGVPFEFPVKNEYFKVTSQSNFSKIPGSPIAYWASTQTLDAFSNSSLNDYGYPKQGFATGDNERFLRLWHEVSIGNIGFGCESREDAQNSNKKWFPCNKGGAFRRWYGNNAYLANWENDGVEMTAFKGSVIRNPQFYFKHGITWSSLTSGKLSMRYSPKGFVFESKGSVCFLKNDEYLHYILGLMNTKIVGNMLRILSPTLDYHEGPMGKVPILIDANVFGCVNNVVKENITLSKNDYDSFETSWDFNQHPLIRLKTSMTFTVTDCNNTEVSYFLHGAYQAWESECEERFNQLKANEEKLNCIFIDTYGLQDNLTPEIEDEDVSVRKANLKRDIKSLISYAVGCMFGRYSLDVEGLAFAGGEWDDSKYSTFKADKDNVIPICDDDYFEDDIVGRFVRFIEVVYGKDTLEENLKFIADALGGSGQPKDVIRKYFMDEFYADHCSTYSVTGSGKRPIYWLFDSGKKGGFRALIYMHRYQPDTIARIRTDYVHEQQSRYLTAIADLEQRIAAASTSERVKLNKRLKKLKEQSEEIHKYEEKIHHLADQYIAIDLDDGVKVNYAKFQDVLAKIK